jgi:hypothetical protein
MRRIRKTKSSKERHKAISLESGHLEGSWQGHFPVTTVAMMSLLERAAAGETKFSPAERILFVACEFWCAFHAGELESHLDLKAEDPTRDARTAFRILGAQQVANALDRGALGPAGGRASMRRRQRLLDLDANLRRVTEPVDLMIARFAWRHMAAQRQVPELNVSLATTAGLLLQPPADHLPG